MIYWDRLRTFYYVMVLTVMLFVMNMTKLWYHEPRPFWEDARISAFDCSTQFGNPSGHSLFSMGVAINIWLDLFVSGTNKSLAALPVWAKTIALFIAISFSFTIGYSRIFLGAHSWN